jgi:hypothetical protein
MFCSSASAAQILDPEGYLLGIKNPKYHMSPMMRGFFCSLFQCLKYHADTADVLLFCPQTSRLNLDVVLQSNAILKVRQANNMSGSFCSAHFQSVQKSTPWLVMFCLFVSAAQTSQI